MPGERSRLTCAGAYADYVAGCDACVVDLDAEWCGPCQLMAPTIEALAEDTAAAVLEVDVVQFEGVASQHDVQGIPTLLVYANGEQAERMVGAQTGDTLETTITGYTA